MLTIPIIQRAFIMMHCVSYGIVVINPDNDELFVVNSSHSYFAGAIIAGKPWFMMDQLTTSEQRQKFVDGMTQTERDMFLSDVSGEKGIYLSLLKRCYASKLKPMTQYEQEAFIQRCVSEYKTTMRILEKHMTESKTEGARPWSFPKGRAYQTGQPQFIQTALRELAEETKVTHDMVTVHEQISPFKITYTDLGIEYTSVLFFATPNKNFQFHFNKNDPVQTSEIASIEWVSAEEFAKKPLCAITKANMADKFKDIIDHFHKHVNDTFSMDVLKNSMIGPGSKPRQYDHQGDQKVPGPRTTRPSSSASSSSSMMPKHWVRNTHVSNSKAHSTPNWRKGD